LWVTSCKDFPSKDFIAVSSWALSTLTPTDERISSISYAVGFYLPPRVAKQ